MDLTKKLTGKRPYADKLMNALMEIKQIDHPTLISQIINFQITNEELKIACVLCVKDNLIQNPYLPYAAIKNGKIDWVMKKGRDRNGAT